MRTLIASVALGAATGAVVVLLIMWSIRSAADRVVRRFRRDRDVYAEDLWAEPDRDGSR